MVIFTNTQTKAATKRPGVTSLLLLCVFILSSALSPGDAAAADLHEQKKKKVEQGIKKATINIGRLQEGIKLQEDQIRQAKKDELDLLAEMQDIDTRLAEQRSRIETLADRMHNQREMVAVKNAEMSRAAGLMDKTRKHVINRMQAFYKLGDLGLIHITFSDQTLPELLRFHDSFKSLIKYDQHLIDTYRTNIAELETAIESLKLQETIFEQLIVENEQERQRLDELKREKEQLLDRIRTQTKLHEQAAFEMEEAAEKLTASLQGLKQQEMKLEQGFLYNKGHHPPPVQGKVIARFNEETTNLLGITSISKGIAIDAPSGSTVRAIYDGAVQYSGYLRGYGNTVIVNHGHQYYSITSRMEHLLVKKGDRVDAATDIGIMGDTATLLTPGLYFELRQGTTNLDPLEWLDTSRLQ
jgi:septal ring factor EnvC (AmiA/AmiB activator)